MDYHFSLYSSAARGKLMTLYLLLTYTGITLLLLAPSITLQKTRGAGYSGYLKALFSKIYSLPLQTAFTSYLH